MSRKIDRAIYGPSLFEVSLGAILSVMLGAVLAFLFLVFKPVVVAKELPKEEDRVESTVYYIEGKDETSRDRQWMHKRQMLLDGTAGEMTLSEDEINACISSGAPKKPAKKRLPPPKPGQPAPKPEPDPVPDDLFTHDVPNVRIHDGVFQVGLPGQLNLITFSVPVIVQSQGTFAKGESMWEYVPSTVYLGSMPLHRIPGLTRWLISKIADTTPIPDQAWAAWKRVDDVSIGGRLMHFTILNGTVPEKEQPAAALAAPATAVPETTVPAPTTSAPAATTSVPAPTTRAPAATTSAPAAVAPAAPTAPPAATK
jgi:hypothetical protein